MPNYCFVYTSISTRKWTDDELRDLLKKSRQKNEQLNITGMLLYLDPFFIQILEGDEQVVNDLFNKIKQDSSHYKVSVIYKKRIPERSFADWTMGFNVVSEEKLAELEGEGFSDFFNNPAADFSHISSEIEHLLKMFKNETLF